MARILKYQLSIDENLRVEVGRGSNPLCVEKQIDTPFVWIQVNDMIDHTETHEFCVILTGQVVPDSFYKKWSYLGTIHGVGGWAVIHVYWTRIV